jgi:hypothetical protein
MRSGRPPFIKHTPMLIWVMVELLRDRRDPRRDRASARDGCERLKKQLAQDFVGGRVLPFGTIRRLYNRFEKTVRHSDSGEELAQATKLVAIGRPQREYLGWDASVWLFVMDPEFLKSKGYDVVINGQ